MKWIDNLKKAIYDHVMTGTNDYKTAVNSQFYFMQAPAGTTGVYAVFYILGGGDDFDTFTEEGGKKRVQISHFVKSKNSTNLDKAADECVEHFKHATITIAGNLKIFDVLVENQRPASQTAGSRYFKSDVIFIFDICDDI